jgi:hypothetical protein
MTEEPTEASITRVREQSNQKLRRGYDLVGHAVIIPFPRNCIKRVITKEKAPDEAANPATQST